MAGYTFKVMKEKNLQPRLLYPARISFRFNREIKSFSDKQKLRIQHHQTNFTTSAKGTSLGGKHKRRKRPTKTIKKMVIGTYISIITLNVNGLNTTNKRHRLAEWIQKQDPYICCPQETHFRPRDTYRLKVKGWKKIFYANGNQKKARVAILVSDKIDFKIKTVTRDKEGHYIMIKGSIQEDITIINIYAPNTEAPQYIRQMLSTIKGEIDSNTIIVGDFNTPLTPMDSSSKKKISKETQALDDKIH